MKKQNPTLKVLSAILAFTSLSTWTIPVYADNLPAGYEAVSGSSSYEVSPDGTTGTLTANDQATIGQWNAGFNIADGHTFNALLPSGDAVHLSRDITANPSQIFGALNVPQGKFFLVNSSGIFFSPTAQVNASGLVASTLDINNQDFLNGRYRFTQNADSNPASVVNAGNMNIGANGAALIGGAVENKGVIVAQGSNLALASGSEATVSFDNSGLLSVIVDKGVTQTVKDSDGAAIKDAVLNKGIVKTEGGSVVMTAEAANNIFDSLVNNEGIVEAQSMGSKEGKILLSSKKSEGIVKNSGTLDASGKDAGEKGGSVVLEGEKVGLMAGSVVDVSGDQGAGTVNVGGGFQGGDSNIRNAEVAYVDKDASVKADAITAGDGGKVVVWADDATRFYGSISAKGGAFANDNGGVVEVSGKEMLEFDGYVDTLSQNGAFGSLLLDPKFIEVVNSGGSAYNSGTNNLFANSAGSTTKITATSISGMNADVTLQANTDVTFTDAVNMTFSNRDLTVRAGRSILVNGNITTNSGKINFTANDSGAQSANRDAGAGNITMASGTTINTGGDTITMTIGSSTSAPFAPGSITIANLVASGSTVTLTGAGAANTVTQQSGTSVSASTLSLGGTSNFTLSNTTNDVSSLAANVTGSVTYRDANNLQTNVIATNGGALDVASNGGDLTVNNTITTGAGNVTLGATGDVNLNSSNSDVTTSGSFTVNADSNANGNGNFIQNNNSNVSAASASITGAAFQSGSGSSIDVGSGAVTLKASTDSATMGLGDASRDFNLSDSELDRITAGSVSMGSATNSGGIFVGSSEAVTAGAKNVNLTTNGGVTFQSNSFTTTGDVTVQSNAVAVNNTVNANNVTLKTNTASTAIGVGTGASAFQVSDTELDNINATGLVTVGDATHTGGITVDAISSNNALKFISNNVTLKNAISTANKAIEFIGNILLGANTTVTTSGANAKFDGTVTGAGNSLNVNTGAGDATFTGAASGLSSNTVTGANIGLKSVTTTGAQSYTGATTLDGTYNTTNSGFTVTGAATVTGATAVNTTGGNVQFTSTVDGATGALTVNAGAGNATFDGAIGSINPLASLGVTAANIFLKNVKTVGAQTYAGATNFGGSSVQVTGAGNALTVNGNSVIGDLDGNSATVDTLSITTNGGAVSFNGKVDGTVNYKQAIDVNTGTAAITFGDSIGSIVPLYGMTLTTTGEQTLPAVISLLNFTIATLNLTADKTIDIGAGNLSIGNVAAGAFNLTLIADEINFTAGVDSVIGTGNLILKSFTTSLKTVVAGAADVASQLDLTLTDLAAIKDGFSSITIGSASHSGGIDINTATFKDSVSFLSPVAGAINVLGTLTGTGTASIFIDGSGSTTHLFADILTNSAAILISDNVILEVASVLLRTDVTGAGADVTVTGTINGASAGTNSLAVTAGTGNVDLQGNIGATSLNNLTVNSATTSRFGGSVTTSGNQNVTAGTIQTNGSHTATTAGSQINLTGNVALQNNTFFNTNNGNVTVTGKINGAKDLTVTAGSGNLSVTDKIGDATALSALTVNSANNATFGNNVTTDGNQSITATTVKTNGTHTTNTAGASIAVNGNLSLQNATNLNTNNGNVTVTGMTDGAQTLGIAAGTGNVSLQGAAGSSAALTSLTASGTGVSVKSVKTTGAQSYTGTTTLNGDLTSTGGGTIVVTGAANLAGDSTVTTSNDITFTSTINGAKNLVLNSSAGNALISGAVGAVLPLLSLLVSATNISVKAVNTTGVQSYTGATTLNGDLTTTDSGSTIDLNGAVDLAGDTNLNTNNGNVTVTGAVTGATKNLGVSTAAGNVEFQNTVNVNSITTSGTGTARFGNNVTTTGNQDIAATTIMTNGTHQTTGAGSFIKLDGATTLENNTQLTTNDGNITATGAVTGAKTLGITAGTGNVDLQSTVNNTSVTVNSATTARFGGNVTTTGNQNVTAGTIQTNGAHTATANGSQISLTGNVALQNNTTLTTNDGNIGVTGTVTGPLFSLNASAGTGTATFGNTVTAASLGVTAANILLSAVTTSGSQTYNAATKTTLAGDLTATTAGSSITLNGNTVLADTASDLVTITTNNGNVSFNGKTDGTTIDAVTGEQSLVVNAGSGDITFADSIGSSVKLLTLTLNNTGAQILPAVVNVTNFVIDTINLAADKIYNFGTSNFSVNHVNTNGHNLTLIADEINFTGGAGTVSSNGLGGNLTLQAFTTGLDIVVADAIAAAANQLDIAVTDLNAIVDGFSNIFIKAANGNGDITIGAFNFTDPMTFGAQVAGAITVQGNLLATDNATLSFLGSGSTFHLAADILTAGLAVLISDNVIVESNATIDTTNAGGAATGGDITVTGKINDDTNGRDLTLTAGTNGNIDLQGKIGDVAALNSLTTTSASTARFGNNVTTVGAQNVTAGTIRTNGVHTVNSTADITLNGSVDLQGNTTLDTSAGNGNVNVNGAVSGSKSIAVNAGAGAATFSSTVSATNVSSTAATTTFTNNVTATTDDVTVTGNLALAGDTTVTTGGGAGDDFSVTGTVSGPQNLTVAAGAGNASFGNTVSVNNLNSTAANTTFNNNVTALTDDVTVNGNLTVAANSVVTTGGAAGDDFTVTGTTDGPGNLTVAAGLGNSNLQGNVGAGVALGALTVNAATARFGGNVTTTGAQSVTASAIQTNGTHTTAGNSITLTGPVTLQNNSGFVSNGGTITFTSTINGAFDLLFSAGAGDVSVADHIGNLVAVADVLIQSAHDFILAAGKNLNAGSLTQSAGTGLTSFTGNIVTTDAAGIHLTGHDFNIGDAVTDTVTTGNGGEFCVTCDGAGTFTLIADLSGVSGQICISGGTLVLQNDIVNSNGISIDSDVILAGAGSSRTLNAGTGLITLGANSSVDAFTNNKNFNLIADEVDLLGLADTIQGNGNQVLTITPFTQSLDLTIGGVNGTSALDLTAAEVATFNDPALGSDNWSQVNIGNASGSGNVTINAITFADPTTIRTPLAPGSIYVNGNITGFDDASITLDGAGATTHLLANIVTMGGFIHIMDSVIVEGLNIILDTTSGPTPAGGDITIDGAVNGNIFGTNNLTLNGGTSGNILLGSSVGLGNRLGALVFTNANNITTAELRTRSIQQVDGQGTTLFQGALNTDGAAGINLNGNNFNMNVSSSVTTTQGGGVTIDHDGLLDISSSAGMNLDGAFLEQSTAGTGTVQLGANITTTNDNITFNRATTLSDHVTLNSAGGNIALNGTVDATTAGAQNLTLIAGTGNPLDGDITTAAIGATTRIGVFTAQNAVDFTNAGVTAAEVNVSNVGGTATFNGVIDTNTVNGITIQANDVALNGATTTTNGGDMVVTNDGNLAIADAATVNLDGEFRQTNGTLASTASLGGNITTSAGNDISFQAPVTLTGADAVVLNSGRDIRFSNTVNGGSDLTMSAARDIFFEAAVGQVARIGNLIVNTVRNWTSSAAISAASITQGAGTGTTTFNGALDTNGAAGINLLGNIFNFNQSVNVANSNMIVNNSGALNMAAAADVTITNGGAGSFSQTGAGAVNTAADVTTDGGSINWNGPITLTGSVSMDSNGGNIIFGAASTINGAQNLTLESNAGNIVMNAAVGAGTRLGSLLVTDAFDWTANSTITAASIRQNAGANTTTFNGALNTNAAGGVNLTGTKFDFINAPVTTTNGGMTLNNSAVATFDAASDVNVSGGDFAQTGTGSTFTAADITTAGGSISFNKDVILTGDVKMKSNNGVITYSDTVDGNHDLTVDSGSGTTNFNKAVGSIVALGDGTGAALILNSTGATTFANTLNTNSGMTAAGPVTFNGNVTLGDGDTGTNLNGNVTLNGISFSGFDGLNFGDAAADQITLGVGPVSVNSNSSALNFNGKVDGAQDLTVDSGAAATNFNAAVGSTSAIGDGTGAALILNSTGPTTFASTLNANSGMTAVGDTTFNGNVTLGNGDTGTNLNGNVTLNGISFSGFDGLTFGDAAADQMTLGVGPSSINSNNSLMTFNALVDGGQNLTLTSGTNDIVMNAAVGSAARLGALLVTSANNWTANSTIKAASIVQNAGTGLTDFNGALDANGAAGINVTTTNLNFDAAATASAGDIRANASNDINVNGTLTASQDIDMQAGNDLTHAAGNDMAAGRDVKLDANNAVLLNGTINNGGAGTGRNVEIGLRNNNADVTNNDEIIAKGAVTINGDVITVNDTIIADFDISGGEALNISANDNAASTANINAGLFTTGGAVNVKANDDVNMAAAGDITSNNGNVLVQADLDGNNTGALNMAYGAADQTVINAGSGTATLRAGEDVSLGRVVTTNATDAAVTIQSTAGRIIDGGENVAFDVDAANGGLVMSASNGIGLSTDAFGAIETNARRLSATTATGDINVDVTSTLPFVLANASVTGGAGNIVIRQLAELSMTVLAASTTNGSITLSSFNDLIVSGNITAAGALAAITLIADANGNGTGNFIQQPGSVINGNGGPVTINGVSIVQGGQIISNGLVAMQAVGDIVIEFISANIFQITAVNGNIANRNGDSAGLRANETSLIEAGGVIGTATGPIRVNLAAGDLIASAFGKIDEVSMNFVGTIPGDLIANLAPGLVMLNNLAVAGSPVPTLDSNLATAFNLISMQPVFNGFNDTRTMSGLMLGNALSKRYEKLFQPSINVAPIESAPTVLVSPTETKKWTRKAARPVVAPVVTPQVVTPITPVVTPTPVVEKPVAQIPTPVVTPAPVVKPAIQQAPTPVAAPIAAPKPVVTPAARPFEPPVMPFPTDAPKAKPAAATVQAPAAPVFKPAPTAAAPVLQPTTPLPGARLFQQSIEEEQTSTTAPAKKSDKQ